MNLFSAIEQGKKWLEEDINIHGAFDIQKGYEAKNYYFNRANLLGFGLSRLDKEFYFETMLKEILNYEKENNILLNKGMIFANLGIAQIRNGNIDNGITNLFRAQQEDELIAPDFRIENTPLWEQFEAQVFSFITSQKINLGNITADEFKNILKGERVFFYSTLMSIESHLNIIKEHPNAYSYAQLYSSLHDLCLLTESLLRKKQKLSGETLSPLLENALSEIDKNNNTDTLTDYKRGKMQYRQNNNITEFLKNSDDVLNESPPLQWILSLLSVRNFTGHHFTIDEISTSPNGRTLFPEIYNQSLKNVLQAIMYLKQENQI